MSPGSIDYQDVLQLIELIKASSTFSEVRLRAGDIEIELRRGGAAPVQAAVETVAAATVASPATPAAAAAGKRRAQPAPGQRVVQAPMVGTLYRAPEPGAAPFVTVGQRVAPGDVLCIIEVMKLMNSISADCHGVVVDILVADAEAVEPGQDLIVIGAA